MTQTAWRRHGDPKMPPLHYRECGLDDVFLASGFRREETPYGAAVVIEDQDGLHKAIAHYLVTSRKPLTGKEIRFLRKHMDWTQADFARLIGVDVQTFARWEKGETRVPGPADRIIRVAYREFADDPVGVIELLKELEAGDASIPDRRLFEATPSGWQVAA